MADKIDIEGSTDNVLTETGDAVLQEEAPPAPEPGGRIDIEGITDNVLMETGDAILQESTTVGPAASIHANALSMIFGRMTVNIRRRSMCDL